MQSINSIIEKASRKLKLYDQEDLRIIIDQIDIPIAVINAENLTITSANNSFCRESNYAFNELVGMQISLIISDLKNLEHSDGITLAGEFIKKNKKSIQCKYTLRLFGTTKKQVILFINLIGEEKEKEISLLVLLINHFLLMIERLLYTDKLENEDILLTNAVEIFQPLEAGFYIKEDQDSFKLVASHKNKILPENIPGIEIGDMQKFDIWTPGKRVLNSIHRSGRINNLPLIITSPINLNQKLKNLLVLAFDESDYRDILGKYINLFCKCANHFYQIEHIRNNSNDVLASLNQVKIQADLIFESIQEGVIIYDISGKIIQINKSALNILGYEPSEIQEENINILFSDEKIVNNLFASEPLQLKLDDTMFIHNREGNKIPVTISINRILSDKHEVFLLIFNDIRESMEQLSALSVLEKKAELGDMVADFAHEVRNPINNISTGLQLMKSRLNAGDSNMVVVERMQNDCIRMNHLMDSILSFSRQKLSEFERININLLIRKITDRFLQKAKSLNINISIIHEVENIYIAGDARALEQAFINILTNAIDAMECKGGVLSIKTEIDVPIPDVVHITISDTGSGIPEELYSRIFEPFISGKPKGTGLGLAITKRIIDAHKGSIRFDTFTTGTIISINFPLLS